MPASVIDDTIASERLVLLRAKEATEILELDINVEHLASWTRHQLTEIVLQRAINESAAKVPDPMRVKKAFNSLLTARTMLHIASLLENIEDRKRNEVLEQLVVDNRYEDTRSVRSTAFGAIFFPAYLNTAHDTWQESKRSGDLIIYGQVAEWMNSPEPYQMSSVGPFRMLDGSFISGHLMFLQHLTLHLQHSVLQTVRHQPVLFDVMRSAHQEACTAEQRRNDYANEHSIHSLRKPPYMKDPWNSLLVGAQEQVEFALLSILGMQESIRDWRGDDLNDISSVPKDLLRTLYRSLEYVEWALTVNSSSGPRKAYDKNGKALSPRGAFHYDPELDLCIPTGTSLVPKAPWPEAKAKRCIGRHLIIPAHLKWQDFVQCQLAEWAQMAGTATPDRISTSMGELLFGGMAFPLTKAFWDALAAATDITWDRENVRTPLSPPKEIVERDVARELLFGSPVG